ncbi:molecular chaperone [Salmonella enterica]|nr:molecular chaperone [Salmonella enterica]
MKIMNVKLSFTGVLCLLSISLGANAALSPDRTRIILNQSDKNTSIRLMNQSPALPYLAQSWIEDKDGKKSRNYISTLPPMVRLEPKEQIQVRLMGQPALAQLPTDRESLFYYNVREIPPRTDQKNVMQIALQSRLKVFWRPKAIEVKEGQANIIDKFEVSRTNDGLSIKNKSPYFITVGYIGSNGKTLMPDTQSMLIEPLSQGSQKIKNLPNDFLIGFVGDYGGLNMFKILCNSVQTICQSEPVKKRAS